MIIATATYSHNIRVLGNIVTTILTLPTRCFLDGRAMLPADILSVRFDLVNHVYGMIIDKSKKPLFRHEEMETVKQLSAQILRAIVLATVQTSCCTMREAHYQAIEHYERWKLRQDIKN